MADDYFSFQSKKQRAGKLSTKNQQKDTVEWPSSPDSRIEVTEHDASSTTVVERLRLWFVPKRG